MASRRLVWLKPCGNPEAHRPHHWGIRQFCRGGWKQEWDATWEVCSPCLIHQGHVHRAEPPPDTSWVSMAEIKEKS